MTAPFFEQDLAGVAQKRVEWEDESCVAREMLHTASFVKIDAMVAARSFNRICS